MVLFRRYFFKVNLNNCKKAFSRLLLHMTRSLHMTKSLQWKWMLRAEIWEWLWGMMRYLSILIQLKVMMFTLSLLKIKISSFIFLHWKVLWWVYARASKRNAQWSRELSAPSCYSNVQTMHKISNNNSVYLDYIMVMSWAFLFGDYYNITYKSVKE